MGAHTEGLPRTRNAPAESQTQGRRLLLALGLIHLIRGTCALGEFSLTLAAPGAGAGSQTTGALIAVVLLLCFAAHVTSLLLSGVGLLARSPWGWKAALFVYGAEVARQSGSLLLLCGRAPLTPASLHAAGEYGVCLVVAGLMLSTFFLGSVVSACRIRPPMRMEAALPWLAGGVGLAIVKVAAVVWG